MLNPALPLTSAWSGYQLLTVLASVARLRDLQPHATSMQRMSGVGHCLPGAGGQFHGDRCTVQGGISNMQCPLKHRSLVPYSNANAALQDAQQQLPVSLPATPVST